MPDKSFTDEAKKSGCKLDETHVWSSTVCKNGALTSKGAKSNGKKTCEVLTTKRAVRCCSEVAVETPSSLSHTCQQLGWPIVSGKCAKSKINGKCTVAGSFDTQKDVCTSVGARMCSVEELEAGSLFSVMFSSLF